MSELLRLIGNIVNSTEEVYSQSNMFTKNLDAVVKQVLTPYLDEVNDDLEERGNTLRVLSHNLTDEFAANDAKLRSTDSSDEERKYKAAPTWVLIFEWLCFVWIILIVFILLVALILRCCGQRWRGESERERKRKCCSQQCGSSLFQLTVYMMSLLFLLALLPIWWNYEHGVGAYNERCTWERLERAQQYRYRRSVSNLGAEATSNLSASETTASLTKASDALASADRHQSMSERAEADDEAGDTAEEPANICRNRENNAFLASNAMKVGNRMAPSLNISEATMELEAKFTKMSPVKEKLKRNAIYADESSLQEICNDFKIQFDLKEFIRYYNEMNSFVSNEMKNPREDLELSHCNLYVLKKHLIDPFDNHEIPKLMAHIAEQCKQIETNFEEGFRKGTESCLTEVEKIERFSKDKLVGVLNDTTQDLDEMFVNGLKNYRSFASEELSRAVYTTNNDIERYSECVQYAHGKNGIWIPLFLILLLFLPLIPIAIYLSRLYSCAERRTECYCYEERLYNAIRDRLYKRSREIES
ncbi:uncharacterized protein LOC118747678 [Rhagoletis pomonella]|uniref:uncharacterized protein LOC118747678 n=1 Tax=Rhagoletis pomonella TaxID=28610 RepID=UPI00177BE099|nr:uncharacterized protein LOC118747678 [Rhagoletis pomonella]